MAEGGGQMSPASVRAVHIPPVSRRRFLGGTAAVAVAATLPLDFLYSAARVSAAAGAHFFTPLELATCQAICGRLIPTDADPGALEAGAANFIDLFLAAFELMPSVADGPLIWMHGRFSSRNTAPGTTASMDMQDPNTGQLHVLPPTAWQELSFRAALYGPDVITKDTSLPASYRQQLNNGLITPPTSARTLYRAGLQAFDDLCEQTFGVHFADATSTQQDAMLTAAGNPIAGQLPVAPQAAKDLYPLIFHNTNEGCFAIPEYGGNRDGIMWKWIFFDGDTEPTGNSVYDPTLTDAQIGPNQGKNTGFGDPAVYTPTGGYHEFRAVSTQGDGNGAPLLTAADLGIALKALGQRRVLKQVVKR